MFRLALILILTLAMPVGKALAVDLWGVYQLALDNDASFQTAKLKLESSRLNPQLASVAFEPTLSAAGTTTSSTQDYTGETHSSMNHELSLQLGWLLYDKKEKISVSQAQQQVEIAELQLKDAKNALIIKVATSYFNLLAAQDAREVAHLHKIAIKRQMDLASKRLEVGVGTQTDFFEAKARYQQAQADEIAAQNRINNAIALLRETIGTTPEAVQPLLEDAPLELPQPYDVENWVNKSRQDNLNLKIQNINLDIAKLQMDRDSKLKSPTLSLAARQSWAESSSQSSSDGNLITVGLSLNVPLHLGGLASLKSRQAGLNFNVAEQSLEQLRKQTETQAISEFLAVNSHISRADALLEAITAGQSALEAKKEEFNAGLTTNTAVLDAQRDLSQSQTSYLQARYDYILSLLRLERVSGDLEENDIQKINSWLGDAQTAGVIEFKPPTTYLQYPYP